jgi:hypothetical protein
MSSATFQTQTIDPTRSTSEPAPHRLAMMKDARFLLGLSEELKAEEQRLAERRLALARDQFSSPATTRPSEPAREG